MSLIQPSAFRVAVDPLPRQYCAEWYAVYTLPRHEKSVALQLDSKAVETYLPLYQRDTRWKDRIAHLQLPLFPGYLFVHIALSQKLRVLSSPGVVRIVSFGGHPLPLADLEIDRLRRSLSLRPAQPWPYLACGKRVRVKAGPLTGLEGIIVRRKGNTRLVVSVDSIQRSIALELEAADVSLLS